MNFIKEASRNKQRGAKTGIASDRIECAQKGPGFNPIEIIQQLYSTGIGSTTFWLKYFLLTAFFLFPVCIQAQKGYFIKYFVNGLPSGKAYLAAVRGQNFVPVDSASVDYGIIEFSGTDSLPPGVYRIIFAGDLFTDIIFNNETVVLNNNIKNLGDSIKIISSLENRFYYSYWTSSRPLNDTINRIATEGSKIWESNGHVMTPQLDSMQRKAQLLNRQLDRLMDSLILASHGLLAQKIILAYRNPDYNVYLKTAGAKPYKTRVDFLREHYFDNIDFSDERLLNTEIFPVVCSDYISTFADPPDDSSYIQTIDFVLAKADANPKVHEYVLDLIRNTFENSPFDEAYIHIIEKYFLKNTCSPSADTASLAEKVAIIRKLKAGNPAPEIKMNTPDGRPIDLFSLSAKAILLFFWSPSCEHCEAIIPDIQNLYSQYHSAGLEVYAVNIGTNKEQWEKTIAEKKLNWINVSDLKGQESPSLKVYNAFQTPTFYILDANKIIVSRPLTLGQISQYLTAIF